MTSNRREAVDSPGAGGKTFPEEGIAVTKTLTLGGSKKKERVLVAQAEKARRVLPSLLEQK